MLCLRGQKDYYNNNIRRSYVGRIYKAVQTDGDDNSVKL